MNTGNSAKEQKYAVNARFVTQPLTGVQRYCYEVCQRLRGGGKLLAPRPALKEYEKLQSRVVVAGWFTGHPWEQLMLPRVIPREQTLFSPAGWGPLTHPNHVVALHDVAPLDHPEWYGGGFALLFSQLIPRLARRARRIVTVSNYCKRRIAE